MSGLDALRCAKLLLDRHGRDAELHAALRIDELEAAGDEAGRRAWRRILAAMDELARTERRQDETLQLPGVEALTGPPQWPSWSGLGVDAPDLRTASRI